MKVENKVAEKLWLTSEAAELLRLHNESIRRMIREGRIAAVRISRSWRIPDSEIVRIKTQGA